jgi:hypothetical protein
MPDTLQFVDYVLEFYGPGGLYDLSATRQEILEAIAIKLTSRPDASLEWCGDSVDRESIRDIMLSRREA